MASFTLEHYAKTFKIFREKSGELREIAEALQSQFRSMIPKLENQVLTRHQLNVLSIGSGSGEMDLEILKILREEVQKFEDCQKMKIYNCAIEPNEYFLSSYQDAIDQGEGKQMTLDRESGVVFEFELLKNTFEQFKQNTAVKFDIIHFVHSIYYLDTEQAFVHCFDKILHENGLLICVVMGADSLMYNVYNKIHKGSLDRNSISKEEDIGEIRKIADKHQWKYEVHSKTYHFDISEIFDENSKVGNLLLDFFTETNDFRSTMDKSVVQEALDFIGEATIVGENGKHFGTIYQHFLFIHKSN